MHVSSISCTYWTIMGFMFHFCIISHSLHLFALLYCKILILENLVFNYTNILFFKLQLWSWVDYINNIHSWHLTFPYKLSVVKMITIALWTPAGTESIYQLLPILFWYRYKLFYWGWRIKWEQWGEIVKKNIPDISDRNEWHSWSRLQKVGINCQWSWNI